MGWRNAFHCEIGSFARRVLDYWYPKAESYGDITKTDFTKWRGRIDVLTGGFPCQPFSLAGRRGGASDNRYLWPEMLRAIREIQPTWVVGENVAGLLTMVQPGEETDMGRDASLFEANHVYRREQEYTIEDICRSLEQAGYSVQAFVIPACAVGAPHQRERVWIIAHRNDAGIKTECKRQNGILTDRATSHTDSTRPRQRTDEQEPVPERGGASDAGHGGEERNVANTDREGLEGMPKQGKSGFVRRTTARHGKTQLGWRDFPTQPPVCGRNDGLPFAVDDLTISFAAWRRESIKAYGNAWVPQVALEIFRAIEQIECNENNRLH